MPGLNTPGSYNGSNEGNIGNNDVQQPKMGLWNKIVSLVKTEEVEEAPRPTYSVDQDPLYKTAATQPQTETPTEKETSEHKMEHLGALSDQYMDLYAAYNSKLEELQQTWRVNFKKRIALETEASYLFKQLEELEDSMMDISYRLQLECTDLEQLTNLQNHYSGLWDSKINTVEKLTELNIQRQKAIKAKKKGKASKKLMALELEFLKIYHKEKELKEAKKVKTEAILEIQWKLEAQEMDLESLYGHIEGLEPYLSRHVTQHKVQLGILEERVAAEIALLEKQCNDAASDQDTLVLLKKAEKYLGRFVNLAIDDDTRDDLSKKLNTVRGTILRITTPTPAPTPAQPQKKSAPKPTRTLIDEPWVKSQITAVLEEKLDSITKALDTHSNASNEVRFPLEAAKNLIKMELRLRNPITQEPAPSLKSFNKQEAPVPPTPAPDAETLLPEELELHRFFALKKEIDETLSKLNEHAVDYVHIDVVKEEDKNDILTLVDLQYEWVLLAERILVAGSMSSEGLMLFEPDTETMAKLRAWYVGAQIMWELSEEQQVKVLKLRDFFSMALQERRAMGTTNPTPTVAQLKDLSLPQIEQGLLDMGELEEACSLIKNTPSLGKPQIEKVNLDAPWRTFVQEINSFNASDIAPDELLEAFEKHNERLESGLNALYSDLSKHIQNSTFDFDTINDPLLLQQFQHKYALLLPIFRAAGEYAIAHELATYAEKALQKLQDLLLTKDSDMPNLPSHILRSTAQPVAPKPVDLPPYLERKLAQKEEGIPSPMPTQSETPSFSWGGFEIQLEENFHVKTIEISTPQARPVQTVPDATPVSPLVSQKELLKHVSSLKKDDLEEIIASAQKAIHMRELEEKMKMLKVLGAVDARDVTEEDKHLFTETLKGLWKAGIENNVIAAQVEEVNDVLKALWEKKVRFREKMQKA